ncbi:TraM recognition domain-containing protein [Defluviimonas salinarum]|uniref:TraM recognition domain-containing protein n=1 Tax=Defluviimonas salinarum TaxID=2992147 RepID=A0ABT3J4E3_9RHOB|nr:TraM recognition domain-containing protein [Defluviimonas salinarum]MCW3782557.1 TraM recognition domain-containing protein [Defluviimonas salinarum]
MAEHVSKSPTLPAAKDSVDPGFVRRPIRSAWQEMRDLLTMKDTVMITMFGSVSVLALFPQTWLGLLPITLGYYSWVSSKKYRLPFKVPQNWGGLDYGAPKPGGSGYSKAGGILYFGRDQASLEELWIENGDARRHGFFLGTTGSGKALPLDTPVLTPRGWVLNGDLGPGDEVCHPFGGTSRILSIHPQGAIPAVRMWFSDGRHADCSLDHLWHVKAKPRVRLDGKLDLPEGFGFTEDGKLMTAGDVGILSGMHGDKLHITIPLARPHEGMAIPAGSPILSEAHARRGAREGLEHLDYMPSLWGSPEERIAFLRTWTRNAEIGVTIEKHGVRLSGLRVADAKIIKQIAWSLGGIATVYVRGSLKEMARGVDLTLMFEGIDQVWPQAAACAYPGCGEGLEVVQVERLEDEVEMSCIKTDREDGLYVMENHVVTHNTELLLGVVSQTLMWSSGFLFIDGKGTTEFYARAWTLAKRFGREDDVRVLNFTDAGGDPDAPAGGPATQSNTVNPFAKGGADQLMNIVVSLMGDAGAGNDMWKNRAMSLVTAEMKALCELRDSGDILLNVQTIRDFLFLGKGFDKSLLKGKKIAKIEDVPEEAWDEMKTRAGLIELYLRAIRGEFSTATKLAMKGFFDTLPGFSIEKAMNGDAQDSKCNEQYGFLSMQLTKPLGSLADDYGHIFRTPLGEVDIDDIVLNRRILIVLLPALQKAPEEMQNCGKIIVTMAKIMMGNASGFMLQGSRQEIVESKQTRAPSPYIVVLDEAGYYMVKGIDVMMAQARSLGFMIIVAGQDMAAMQAISPQIAETAAANASIFAAGKTVDGDKTVGFIQKLFGRTQVAVTSGFQSQPGFFANRWVDRMDASFQEVDKVKVDELQNMMEGEFYFLFNGTLVKASTFYIGSEFAANFSVNKFLKVRGPTDRVPGLDQRVEIEFIGSMVRTAEKMLGLSKDPEAITELAAPRDGLAEVAGVAGKLLWSAGDHAANPRNIHHAWLGAIMAGGQARMPGVMVEAEDDKGNWEDELDIDLMGELGIRGNLDGDDFAPEGRARRDGGRPAHRRESDDFDDFDLGDDGDGEVGDVVSGLARAARGRTPQERHGGMIDLLIAQERAKETARRNLDIEEHIVSTEVEEKETERENRKSMGEFFNYLAENSNRFAKIFAEEDVNGELGLDILRRSGTTRPIPLASVKDSGFMNAAVDELEKIISTEQK